MPLSGFGPARKIMWIVKVALQRPYTFIMLAVLIVLMGGYAILNTATDIFPNIKIPIAAVIWRYNGILPEEIANRIVLFSERVAQTTVNDVEHTESQSVNGTAVVKYFFQPDADQDLSMSQITAVSQTQLAFSPPGTTPPFVLSYSASSVPILQLALSSDTLPESQIYDLGNTILRTQLATVAGASIPFPFGGKQRQVQVDLDPQALRARGLSGNDVVAAIGAQNLILPAGTQKIGPLEYFIKLNASPTQIEDLNNMPIRARNGAVTYIHDVAHVRDGYSPQTSIVRLEGRRAVLMSVLKTGKASTIDIINGINEKLPQIRASLPPELKIEPLSDQSVFVRAAISGVVREAVIAGALTGLLILLFLGSWRSTLIITISIPLSILASIYCLSALGETINIMTLGGLALAVGILVDDATVTIENINYHLERGKDVETAILDGAHQIALPALVSTLSICIVFVPMFLLAGIAKFLFIPLAEAVVFAMLASYILSRTLVPTLAKFWLKQHDPGAKAKRRRLPARFQQRFERGFDRMRDGYRNRAAGISARASAGAWPGLLPVGRRRPDQAASARPHRHANRRNRGALRCGRSHHPRCHPQKSAEQHRRQSGAALQRHQSGVQHVRAGRSRRRRHLRQSEQGSCADGGFRPRAAHQARGYLSVDHFRVPAGRYDQPDIELRPALPHRCANRGLQCAGEPRVREHPAAEAARRGRRGRSAYPPIRRLSAVQRGRRPHQGAAAGPDGAIRGEQYAGVSVRKLPDGPVVLGRPQERHAVPSRHANSAIPFGESQRPRQHSVERRDRRLLADSVEPRQHSSQRGSRGREPLQRHSGDRYLRIGPGHRSWLCVRANH
jgi:hypothetical protein